MRNRTLKLAAWLAALALPAFAADPARRPSKEYTIEQFMATTAIRGAAFSSDGKRLLFSSNASGIYNVQSLATTGGEPAALTHSTTDTTLAVSYFPNDDRFLYTRDQGGNELNHLYVQTPAGQERDLTPGDKLKAMFARWTRDGRAFYVRSNERDAALLRHLPLRREVLRPDADLQGRGRATTSATSPRTGRGSHFRRSTPRPTATSISGTRERSR